MLISETINRLVGILDRDLDKVDADALKWACTHLTEAAVFRLEWSARFGFLADKYPRDSFASIDEVACMFHERMNASFTKEQIEAACEAYADGAHFDTAEFMYILTGEEDTP